MSGPLPTNHPILNTEEYTIRFFSPECQAAPTTPTIALSVITPPKNTPIELSTYKGITFCNVLAKKKVFHFNPRINLTSHRWRGAAPSLISTLPTATKTNNSLWVHLKTTPLPKKTLEAILWMKKYLNSLLLKSPIHPHTPKKLNMFTSINIQIVNRLSLAKDPKIVKTTNNRSPEEIIFCMIHSVVEYNNRL